MSDYIDRQAAKLAIVEEGQRSKRYKLGEFWELNRDEVWDAIDSVPSADVEPARHGRWIDAEIQLESGGSMPIQACSLCKTFYPLSYTGWGHRFCPNCGARMDGEADG